MCSVYNGEDENVGSLLVPVIILDFVIKLGFVFVFPGPRKLGRKGGVPWFLRP